MSPLVSGWGPRVASSSYRSWTSCVAYRTLINSQALFNHPEFEAARYPIQGGLARLRGERFSESSEFF